MNIEKALGEFGLTGNKNKVYIATLKLGTAPIQQIAKQAELPRTTVYEVLHQLTAAGFTSFVYNGKKRIYSATHPERLLTMLKFYERHLTNALPEFLSIYKTGNKKPLVKFYEGAEGIKSIMEDTFKSKAKTMRYMLSVQDLFQSVGSKYMNDYTKKRINAKIELKVIRSETQDIPGIWPSSTKELREVHYTNKNISFPLTLILYDKKLAIISKKHDNFGIIIESDEINSSLTVLFEIMWQICRTGKFIN